MPLLAADPVTVLPEQREALERLVRTHSTPQQLALRARIILHATDGTGARANARELGVWPKTVRYWRKRWRQAAEGHAVPERLADAPRSGAPATFTAEQICALVAIHARSRRRASVPSAIGASARLPTKPCDVASFRTSRSARWGVF